MQQMMQTQPKTTNTQPVPSHPRRQGFIGTWVIGPSLSVFALLIMPAILSVKSLPAQTHAPQTTKPVQQQKTAAPEVTTAPSPASPTSTSPNEPPNQAKVSWDSRGLEIEASNSSLNQILRQIAADTGAKLEGLTQDQRVFGSYGPGPGREVLLKLLDGSGYNVLVIGGRNADALLEIVLSARSLAGPQTATSNQNRSNSKDDESGEQLESKLHPDYPPDPSRSQSVQNPFGNGEPPRDPLQFMQEILQRQQKIDQQQNQQNNPQQ